MSECRAHPVIGPTATAKLQDGTDQEDEDKTVSGWHVAETGGSNAVTAIARVGSASGALLGKAVLAAHGAKEFVFDPPVRCKEGVHVTVSGTGTLEHAFYIV